MTVCVVDWIALPCRLCSDETMLCAHAPNASQCGDNARDLDHFALTRVFVLFGKSIIPGSTCCSRVRMTTRAMHGKISFANYLFVLVHKGF